MTDALGLPVTRLAKQCSCSPMWSTNSGPRPYLKTLDGTTTVAGFAEMVCDRCETPWERVPVEDARP